MSCISGPTAALRETVSTGATVTVVLVQNQEIESTISGYSAFPAAKKAQCVSAACASLCADGNGATQAGCACEAAASRAGSSRASCSASL